MEENEKKGKATRKEIMMVIVVVVLAFGLTVAGIVYLTNFLIGGSDKPQPAQITQPALPDPEPDAEPEPDVVVFDNNNAGDPAVTPSTPQTQVVPENTVPVTPVAPTPPTPQQIASVTPTPTTSGVGTHQLQLFAFRSLEKAQTEANKYLADCPDIKVVKADLGDNGVWYRVRGCTGSQSEITAKKADLEKKYNITPYIVKVQ